MRVKLVNPDKTMTVVLIETKDGLEVRSRRDFGAGGVEHSNTRKVKDSIDELVERYEKRLWKVVEIED